MDDCALPASLLLLTATGKRDLVRGQDALDSNALRVKNGAIGRGHSHTWSVRRGTPVPLLTDLELYLEPPEEMIVFKSFSKIRRELKDKGNAEKAQKAREKKEYPMHPTIAYRE